MSFPLAPLPLVLSPMVDVTDAAFRSVAKDWGADVTCSEMVSAAGLTHGNETSWKHVAPWPGESPYGVQIMTGDPEEAAAATRMVGERHPVDFLDLNLGCPSPNILRACAGGFLLRDPEHAGKVIAATKDAADEVGIPHVSAKLRLGMDTNHLTFLEVAQAAQDAGASWVTLHGRTVEQGYSGRANWGAIRELVGHASIPVIGNGDLRTPEDVLRMRRETGCEGFFIARAAMNDPTVFRRMRQALDADDARMADPAPPLDARLQALEVYLDRAADSGVTNIAVLKRQATRFVSGAPGAKRIRTMLQAVKDAEALRAAIRSSGSVRPAS